MERTHTSPTTPADSETTATAVDGPATIAATRTSRTDTTDEPLPNTLTVIGRGAPSSFEVTVDGELEPLCGDGDGDVTVRSGSTVEGTIETGTIRFRFDGELADVTFVDRRITGLSPVDAPNVHVNYGSH